MASDALSTDVMGLLNPIWTTELADVGDRFRAADPFPHIVIDDFIRPEICDALVSEFPSFASGNSTDENGTRGRKAVREDVRALGPAFRAMDDLAQSPEFLKLLSTLTGIDGLLYDPDYVGGGTHENRPGQNLDFHVDFNRHPRGWDRRLNLLLYLNPEWQEGWGGCIELRRHPRDPARVVAPILNRAVLFETSGRSWHGFDRISAPDGVSRKSLAFYFYTDQGNKDAAHSTIYVEAPFDNSHWQTAGMQLRRRRFHMERLFQRELEFLEQIAKHLDARVAQGPPTEEELELMRSAVALFDDPIEFMYGRESELRESVQRAASLPRGIITGLLRQISLDGIWHDNWAAQTLRVRTFANAAISAVTIRGIVPNQIEEQEIRFGEHRRTFKPGNFEWTVPLGAAATEALDLRFDASTTFSPKRLGMSSDVRDLAWLVEEIRGI